MLMTSRSLFSRPRTPAAKDRSLARQERSKYNPIK